ncbi:MAG: YbhB/YbcL family Raf kinase inhibitor-like protein [Myxococcales bacterium]|nr:YbhB/YbcL family Raf kinase inhibitor-like protein [Myxococcales bacterium]
MVERVLLVALVALGGCKPAPTPVPFRVWSPDFEPSAGHPREDACESWLPQEHECFGSNPEIAWEGVPEGTVSLALIFDDPDAGGFPHWAIFNLDPALTGLPAGLSGSDVDSELPGSAIELRNGADFRGYLGSCPSGTNLYRWRLFALTDWLEPPFASFEDLSDAAEAVQIERVDMCHVYGPATI